MKLCVHFISKGVYWKAGDDIPDDEVPASIRKYAVTGNGEVKIPAPRKAKTEELRVEQKLRKRYVRRGVAWRRVKDVMVKVGEPIFVRIGPSHYEEIGHVSSDGSLPQVFL